MHSIVVEQYSITLRFFVDRYHFQATADVRVCNRSDEPLTGVTFYLHPELHVARVASGEGTSELTFETRLFLWDHAISNLLREVKVSLPEALQPAEQAELSFDYHGWLHPSGVQDNSDRYMGIESRKAFLRGMMSTLWFPCPYKELEDGEHVSDFRLTLDTPDDLRAIGFGRMVEESCAGGRRESVWETDQPVSARVPMIWVDQWDIVSQGNLRVYHKGSPDSLRAAEHYLDICSALKAFFDEHYTSSEVKEAIYHIAELDVPTGGYPAQCTVGFARSAFADILDPDRRNPALLWIGHEMVHEYVRTPIDHAEPGAVVVDDGFALYFHIPALVEVLGDEYEVWILNRAWQNYERGLSGGSDGEGPLPPEKPLVEVETEEYYRNYKDRFLMSDKQVIVLHRLRQEMRPDIFVKAVRDYFAAHRVRPATYVAFKEAMQEHSGKDLSEFFRCWFETTERLPDEWRPRTEP